MYQDVLQRQHKQELANLPKHSNLNGTIDEYPPFVYHHMGSFAYVGDYTAIMELRKENKIKSSGMMAWMWWRSAYMSKLLSARNRTFVAIDWVKAFVFGRDISRG